MHFSCETDTGNISPLHRYFAQTSENEKELNMFFINKNVFQTGALFTFLMFLSNLKKRVKRKFFVCLFDSQFFGSVFLRSGFKTLLSRTDGALGEKMI